MTTEQVENQGQAPELQNLEPPLVEVDFEEIAKIADKEFARRVGHVYSLAKGADPKFTINYDVENAKGSHVYGIPILTPETFTADASLDPNSDEMRPQISSLVMGVYSRVHNRLLMVLDDVTKDRFETPWLIELGLKPYFIKDEVITSSTDRGDVTMYLTGVIEKVGKQLIDQSGYVKAHKKLLHNLNAVAPYLVVVVPTFDKLHDLLINEDGSAKHLTRVTGNEGSLEVRYVALPTAKAIYMYFNPGEQPDTEEFKNAECKLSTFLAVRTYQMAVRELIGAAAKYTFEIGARIEYGVPILARIEVK